MTDIFLPNDLRHLLAGKKVVFMGDSNVRSYYKDILCLYNDSQIIGQQALITKMENSVFGDKLLKHREKTNARHYQEERVFCSNSHYFSFYFITRVYNEYMEKVLQNIIEDRQPDVLVLNSCLWDMVRWGPKGVEEFKVNLVKLMNKLNEILDKKCLVIWMTAPPLAQKPQGGFLLVQLDFLKYSLRFHVMEANAYSAKVVVNHGYDVLDVHYHLRMQLQRRSPDGIHWSPQAVRYITNLLLTHISLAWNVPLPHRHESLLTLTSLQTLNGDNDMCILEVPTVNTEVSSNVSKKKKNNRRKAAGKSACAFARDERLSQAHQNIRKWRTDLSHTSRFNRFPHSSYVPYETHTGIVPNPDWCNSDLPPQCIF